LKAKVIVNPAARRGKSGKSWPEVEQKLRGHLGDFDPTFTDAPGAGNGIAKQALQDGHSQFVVVGGDGTLNEVLNGITEDGRLSNPDSLLCPIPAGTANETCRALGMLKEPDGAFRALSEGTVRPMDLIMADCQGLDGGTVRRAGILLGSVGSAAEISYRTNNSRFAKRLGREFSYYFVTIMTTLTYKPPTVRMRIDDAIDEEVTVFSVLCCNVENAGGGMRIAPGAQFDDGMLDIVMFGDMKRREILLRPPSWLFEGRHVDHPLVRVMRGRHVQFDGDPSVLVDMDGETIGHLPVTIDVVPGALNVKY